MENAKTGACRHDRYLKKRTATAAVNGSTMLVTETCECGAIRASHFTRGHSAWMSTPALSSKWRRAKEREAPAADPSAPATIIDLEQEFHRLQKRADAFVQRNRAANRAAGLPVPGLAEKKLLDAISKLTKLAETLSDPAAGLFSVRNMSHMWLIGDPRKTDWYLSSEPKKATQFPYAEAVEVAKEMNKRQQFDSTSGSRHSWHAAAIVDLEG